MKISIITVSFNSSKTIRDTIQSVLSQHYSNIEYIIVDGGSTDGTLDIIHSYEHKNIKWISEPDKGIYDAMNKGLSMSTGDIIGILNSDDFYLHRNVISKVAETFLETQAESVYSDLAYVDAINTNKIIRYWRSGSYKDGSFLQGWMPPHPTFFVKKEIYQKYSAFNLRFKSAADYELMLRLLHKHKITTAYIPDLTVMMRAGGKSNANLKSRLHANAEDRLAWKLNKLNPYPYTLLLKPLRKIEQYLFLSNKLQTLSKVYNFQTSYDFKTTLSSNYTN
ncbi:glycosyltransferase [Rhodocytophaga rosea]|uniref:Glycosyltransferase n=1 Tax=Rhodocytophaga rosea TaxID=2704465 RepID=A0A6C0GCX5_9BACT|nr:glycosyltransferase family 2 protein [Rhodocytophaga rosea]QHT65757.1 glycosyltransferase [Rhodocytophaga rosea]